jgi:predicted metal-binding protein
LSGREYKKPGEVSNVSNAEDPRLSELLDAARAHGVSDVKLIQVRQIEVDDGFRTRCEEPRCPGYGTSINCPPHSMPPSEFRTFIAGFHTVLAFKFDFPAEAVMGEARREAGLLLHETTAAIEAAARGLGFARARGFSSGGCKQTLCSGQPDCAALSEAGRCRNPDKARPSLSGMGVNWHALSGVLGWQMRRDEKGRDNPGSDTVMMSGLVFLE